MLHKSLRMVHKTLKECANNKIMKFALHNKEAWNFKFQTEKLRVTEGSQ